MEKIDYIKEFKEFLREHNVAAKFYNNCRLVRRADSCNPIKLVDKYLQEVHYSSFLLDSFAWDNSIENFDYWDSLDNIWQERINRLDHLIYNE